MKCLANTCLESVSEDATAALACALAPYLRVGDVVTLHGDLGMGKTVFARALVQALLHQPEDVPSPTFTLVQTYDSAQGPVWHFDLYRLKAPDEVLELGWEDALSEAICLVEWPERLGPWLPRNRLEVHLAHGKTPEKRRIILKPFGTWEGRLPPAACLPEKP